MRRMPALYLGPFAAISVGAVALVLLSAGAAHSLDLPDYNVWMQAFFRNRTGFFLDHAKSFDGKSATLDRFEQSLWFDAKKQFLQNLTATIKLRVFGDNVFDLQTQNKYWSSSSLAERNLHHTFDLSYDDFLREVYADYDVTLPPTVGKLFLRLGKQQIAWGKADGFRLLDIINPFDFREPLYPTFEEVRIPLWMARIDYTLPRTTVENGGFEVVWSPIYQQDIFPPPIVSPWSFRAFDTFQQAANTLHFRIVPNLFDQVKEPGLKLSNSEAGIRWSQWIKNFGYTINYFYDWTNLPHVKPKPVPVSPLDPLGFVYENTPDRVHRIGGSFDYNFYQIPLTTITNVVLRGEMLYSKDNVFYGAVQPDGTAHYVRDSFDYVIGLDKVVYGLPFIAPRANTQNFLSFQIFQTFLPDFKRSDGLTNAGGAQLNDVKTSFTFFLQNTSLASRLTSEALIFYSDAGEWWFRPRFTYDVSDAIKAEIGAQIFFGHQNDFIGGFQSKGMQEVFWDLRYQFL